MTHELRHGAQGIAAIDYTHISNAAIAHVFERDNTKSSYTACIDDVENGRVDMCAADFWITSDRLARVPFTMPMTMQKIQLFIPQGVVVDPPLKEMLGAVFRPFEPSVWVFIFALAILVGLLDMWLNSNQWWNEIDLAESSGVKYAPRLTHPPPVPPLHSLHILWSGPAPGAWDGPRRPARTCPPTHD